MVSEACPGLWIGCGVGRPCLAGQGQCILTQRTTLRPQPGQQVGRQLADADETLDTGHLVNFDQLQPARQARQAGEYPNQEQLVVSVSLAPQHNFAVAVKPGQCTTLGGLTLFNVLGA
ncbi:hypothetical protein D3C76_1145460 [compost metagenome]